MKHLLLSLALLAAASPLAAADHEIPGLSCEVMMRKSIDLLPNEPIEALTMARNAAAMASTLADPTLELKTLRTLAKIEGHMGLQTEFLQTTLKAIEVASVVGDAHELALLMQDLSTAYARNYRPDLALEEARKAVALLTPIGDPEALSGARLFLARAFIATQDHANATSILKELASECRDRKDGLCTARADHAMARVLMDQQKFADALPFLVRSSPVVAVKGDASEKFRIINDRVITLIGLGHLKPARELLYSAGSLSGSSLPEEDRLELMRTRYLLALEEKNWQQALQQLQQLNSYTDSRERTRVHMNMAALQVAHQIGQEQQDNDHLRQVNEQQEIKIMEQRASNQVLWGLLGAFVLLATTLFFIGRRNARLARRIRLKSEVIKRQHEEIQLKVLELQRKNVRLAECIISDEGKELMLKEIHHRVKNNLQVVDSMINLHIGDIPDEQVRRLLRDAQGRIRSMAMVHEHIYRANGTSSMPLRTHLERLGRSILVAHGVHDRISIIVNTDLPNFPVETLMPFSLLVNELVTNSIKHAFPGDAHGSIRMIVRQNEKGYELRYSDDGVGINNDIDITEGKSFGHELVRMLAQQLNGTVNFIRGSGVVFSLTFLPDKEILRIAS